jgi:hypothetical protein
MVDDSKKRPGSKTWLDILGQRMEAAKASAAEAESELLARSRRVRFSDLTPPGQETVLGSRQTNLMGATDVPSPPAPARPVAPVSAAPTAPTRPLPVAPGESAEELRRKLKTSEDKCREAEARVSALQSEVDALRDLISQANVGEVEQLRLRLAEAHEIIRAIEQAYLAGECPSPEPPL